jgi:tetratricopeptide (TPR) repeat protein
MASIIPGFEYDIFISYRQKDNKYDGWVTEFVDNLKKELESTFKEEISVYFDINPHDGLLETHDVDASLREKLKCLVLIPIISRTYCDPKSFAWEHEFKAFVDLASHDQFGMKVKLANGNVASRVLPIRIYDLEYSDISLCESVLGSVLRGVEFIYEEPGVNRPLKSDDDGKINLNKTKYRNQINKIGNAIKEIITGLKIKSAESVEGKILPEQPQSQGNIRETTPRKSHPFVLINRKLISGIVVLSVLLLTAIFFAFPGFLRNFRKVTLEKLQSSDDRITIAVMPFQNMTNDTVWDVWQSGIQDILITSLSNSEELKVRQTESINNLVESQGILNYASITPTVASSISQKLDAVVLIYGNIKQAGSELRIYAQLINSETQEVLKSLQAEGFNMEEDIFHLIDTLSLMIQNSLIISKLQKQVTPETRHQASTNSPEAYRYFILGSKAFMKRDYSNAIKLFSQALAIDSTFTFAALSLSIANGNLGIYDEAKKWCLVAYEKKDQMPLWQKTWISWVHAIFLESPREEIKYLEQLKEIDDQYSNPYSNLGYCYIVLHQYDKAIQELVKVLEIYKKWDSKPSWIYDYTMLGYAYHKTGQYKKEKKLYKKAELDYPDDPLLIQNQAILSLTEGNTNDTNNYVRKYESVSKSLSIPEVEIITGLANIYSETNNFDKAEILFRQALLLEPENTERLKNLAFFLIDKNRNNRDIYEGLEIVEKALKSSPEDYSYLDCKGWGLYKQGKYEEAVELLKKSWSLIPVYDHEIFLHLEAAKKAVAGIK